MLNCSIGIMAYNEEANIGRLLESLSKQKLSQVEIKEIIVVASGCTDNTEQIVKEHAHRNPKVKLLVQKQRKGKASAINLFLSHAKGDILVLESADTLPAGETIEKLLAPFNNPQVGMTGGRPWPINGSNGFLGYAAKFLWWMHHRLSLREPKLGEIVAFRNFIKQIPYDTAVDEACIEALVTQAGYKKCYVKDAFVYNKGPENLADFLKQRRRIYTGHVHLKKTYGYLTSSMETKLILSVFSFKIYKHVKIVFRLAKTRRFRRLIYYLILHIQRILWVMGAICIEIVGRSLGIYDFYIRKKKHYIWDIAKSTKRVVKDGKYSLQDTII